MSALARVGCVILAFALGCVASVGLWILWTPACDANCPVHDVAGMMIFVAVLPSLCAMTTVLLLAMKWPARVKLAVLAALLVAAAGIGIYVGHAAVSSAKMAGLR